MQTVGSYLKKHSEALVKDGGIENACTITDKSKALLGRYYSDNPEHYDRYMPIDAVAALEKTASFPHLTTALAKVIGATLSCNSHESSSEEYGAGGVNSYVIALSQRFAILMSEYYQSIEDGIITINEAKRLLCETVALQQVLADMKMHLEEETN